VGEKPCNYLAMRRKGRKGEGERGEKTV